MCLAVFLAVGGFILLELQNPDKTQVLSYETAHLNKNLYQGGLYAQNLCVTTGNTELEGFPGDGELHALRDYLI